jgi:hypothetical protein
MDETILTVARPGGDENEMLIWMYLDFDVCMYASARVNLRTIRCPPGIGITFTIPHKRENGAR